MAFDDVIASIGNELGMDMAVKDGVAEFAIAPEDGGERVVVSASAMDDGVSVELCADLGEMPSEGASELMLRMLEANHLFASTGGATLSVDGGRVKLERYVGIAEFERGEGLSIVASFIETAKAWSDIVVHSAES